MENRLTLALVASLTLGLAPFTPEPHIWEKIQIISTGSRVMEPMDWFDVLLHGSPWVWLLVELFLKLKKKKQND